MSGNLNSSIQQHQTLKQLTARLDQIERVMDHWTGDGGTAGPHRAAVRHLGQHQ